MSPNRTHFRIRSLLLLTVAAAVVCLAWSARRSIELKRQRDAEQRADLYLVRVEMTAMDLLGYEEEIGER